MNDIIRVSTEKMSQDKERIEQRLGNAGSNITKLGEAMEALSTCWEGPAWGAFQQEVSDSLDEMNEICKFVKKFTENEKAAEKTYADCETSNRNRVWMTWI